MAKTKKIEVGTVVYYRGEEHTLVTYNEEKSLIRDRKGMEKLAPTKYLRV